MNNNNLFNAIRLISENKGLNNDLKSIQARANENLKKVGICPIGQIQMQIKELRGIITNSGATKNVGYELTPQSTIFDRCLFIDGLEQNAQYPIFKSNCSKWNGEEMPSGTTDTLSLTPHRLYSEFGLSLAIMHCTDGTLQNAIEQEIINCIFEKAEKTLLSDDDTTNGNPQGILGQISATTTSALSIDNFTDIEKAFFESGAKEPIYLFSPNTYAQAKKSFKELFVNGKFNDIDYIVSNNMQSEYILLCDLSKLMVEQYGAIDIMVDNVTKKVQGLVVLRCDSFFDWGLLNAKAFQAIKIS